MVNQETPRVCVARAARWGRPTHTAYTLPHNPGTPRWHAGVRDGRAGVGEERGIATLLFSYE